MTPAERFHAAQVEMEAAADAISTAVEDAGLWPTDDDFTFGSDAYDKSLEVFAPKAERLDEIAAVVLALGFDRCWIHLHSGVMGNRCGACKDAGCGGGRYFVSAAVRERETRAIVGRPLIADAVA